jgi:phospholipid-binding lipoprotein MlaA
MESGWGFLFNTCLGFFGLFDMASKLGLKTEKQKFGDTLAHYGAEPGPYIVLPLIGGTFGRDMLDALLLNNAIGFWPGLPNSLNLSMIAMRTLHERSVLLPLTDTLESNSTDYYISIRSALFQSRESQVLYPESFDCLNYEGRSRK